MHLTWFNLTSVCDILCYQTTIYLSLISLLWKWKLNLIKNNLHGMGDTTSRDQGFQSILHSHDNGIPEISIQDSRVSEVVLVCENIFSVFTTSYKKSHPVFTLFL